MYKNIIIIQARMGSSRLPGKSLMPIWNDMVLLEVILRRISNAKTIDSIILATSTNKKDDVLLPIAEKCNIDVFRGSENDVLDRFASTLEKYPAEAVVRACADNPFLDPIMIDNLTTFFWEKNCDYASNLGNKTELPDSVGAEMVSSEMIQVLDKIVENKHHREHVLSYLYDNKNYRCCFPDIEDKYKRPEYRIDVDYKEDMNFIKELIKKLPKENAPYWSTMDIIKTLDNNKELLKLRKVRR